MTPLTHLGVSYYILGVILLIPIRFPIEWWVNHHHPMKLKNDPILGVIYHLFVI